MLFIRDVRRHVRTSYSAEELLNTDRTVLTTIKHINKNIKDPILGIENAGIICRIINFGLQVHVQNP